MYVCIFIYQQPNTIKKTNLYKHKLAHRRTTRPNGADGNPDTIKQQYCNTPVHIKSHLDNRRLKTNTDDAIRTSFGGLFPQFNRRQAKE